MRSENNKEIRDLIYTRRLTRWQVADLLGVSETTIYNKLRHELPAEEKERWLKLIQEAER